MNESKESVTVVPVEPPAPVLVPDEDDVVVVVVVVEPLPPLPAAEMAALPPHAAVARTKQVDEADRSNARIGTSFRGGQRCRA
jgi:hypothetical protein